jgi:hypothetical protein
MGDDELRLLRRVTNDEILKDLRLFKTPEALRKAVKELGFPEGRRLTDNRRTRSLGEIEAWIASRPAEAKPLPPGYDPSVSLTIARARKVLNARPARKRGRPAARPAGGADDPGGGS